MKTISFRTAALVAPLLGAIVLVYGCAPDDPTISTGTGGSTAGSTAQAGDTAVAGSTTTAGSPAAGGSTGTAGTPSTGGSGTAGSGTAGSGGSGTAGSGGSGTAGSGGSGGEAAGGCADPKACITEVFPADKKSSFGNPPWSDSWWVTGCSSKHDHDCYTIEQCPAEGDRTTESFPVGGVAGQHYQVDFTYNAVNEGRGYTGGTKDKPVAADLNNIDNNDSFYRDGDAPASKYNELKLTIYDDKMVAVRHYYMNAFSQAQENHLAFLSSYKKSIVIVGGGKIEHMVFDSNCHAIDNCNAGEVIGTTCNSPRRLPGADGQLMLPPFYANPNDGYKVVATNLISITAARTQPWKSQASHLTITAIKKTDAPVTMNFPDPQ